MRRLLHELSHFNRAERFGAVGLAVLIGLGLLVNLALRLTPDAHAAPSPHDRALAARWEAFRTQHGIIDTGRRWAHRWEDEGPPVAVVLAPFDPNTIDSMGIRRLGLSALVAKSWLNWRDRYGKKFYDAEDLKPMYNLAAEDWARIAPYVRSSLQRPERKPWGSYADRYDVPAIVDINTADTTLLDRAVRGIGPYLARRIIQRRDALGGYFTLEQVTDGLRMPDSTVEALQEKLRFDAGRIKRLSLNSASLEQLKAHPYVGEKIAGNILLFRSAIKQFENLDQLRQVPLMTGEIYRKIAPYFKVD